MRFGTKWLSITSTCSQSAPATAAARRPGGRNRPTGCSARSEARRCRTRASDGTLQARHAAQSQAAGQRRRSSAQNIASVPCRCGQSCTVGPSPSRARPANGRARRSAPGSAASTAITPRGLGRVRRAGDVGDHAARPGQPRAPRRAARAAVRPVRRTSLGWRRQRASGRRRSAPRPVQGASSSTRSNPPPAPAELPGVADAHVDRPRRAVACATSSARCGRSSLAVDVGAPRGRPRVAASSAALPPGPAHRSSQRSSGRRAAHCGQREGAQLAALVLHGGPARRTDATRPGSPPARRTAERRVRPGPAAGLRDQLVPARCGRARRPGGSAGARRRRPGPPRSRRVTASVGRRRAPRRRPRRSIPGAPCAAPACRSGDAPSRRVGRSRRPSRPAATRRSTALTKPAARPCPPARARSTVAATAAWAESGCAAAGRRPAAAGSGPGSSSSGQRPVAAAASRPRPAVPARAHGAVAEFGGQGGVAPGQPALGEQRRQARGSRTRRRAATARSRSRAAARAGSRRRPASARRGALSHGVPPDAGVPAGPVGRGHRPLARRGWTVPSSHRRRAPCRPAPRRRRRPAPAPPGRAGAPRRAPGRA